MNRKCGLVFVLFCFFSIRPAFKRFCSAEFQELASNSVISSLRPLKIFKLAHLFFQHQQKMTAFLLVQLKHTSQTVCQSSSNIIS